MASVFCLPAQAKVLLQGFYWNVPSPAAGDKAATWWWDSLAAQANALARAGFTAIWIPPVVKGASGGYSVGYDPFDDYDLGSKFQKGTLPLRYGTREQLERTVAIMRANGLSVYVDLVENHRDGDPGNYRFRYHNSAGVPATGRFPKNPDDFHPFVPQDPGVPAGSGENFTQFGRDLAPVNGDTGEVSRGLDAAGDWLTRSLGVQGYRLDYVKGISTVWLREFLNYGAMRGKFAVGEYYDSNLDLVSGWVSRGMRDRCSAFDFPLRDLLKQMCEAPGSFDMARLDHAGLAGIDPEHAVTFVENHDTDRSDPVVHGKALAYAYILTSAGYPCVFYRDYSMDPGCYHLKPVLDPLIQIHETLAAGPTRIRFKAHDTLVYERLGLRRGAGLLVALNENRADGGRVTVATAFGPHVRLRDYTGHEPPIETGENGSATFSIPPDRNGGGYVCYARFGAKKPVERRYAVTQQYAGAGDLDIAPASHARWVKVCRIWAEGGRSINASLTFDTRQWTSGARIEMEAFGPDGRRLTTFAGSCRTRQGRGFSMRPRTTGWVTFRVHSFHTPAANRDPAYTLRVTYFAPMLFRFR
ncbi:MAG TPA: alpha-amylase family glycosyl hydrolase [Armatimonadota bacterium]|nr:alpha-amylase family glycosyl hydrolase [Armatimonadota bacterium]